MSSEELVLLIITILKNEKEALKSKVVEALIYRELLLSIEVVLSSEE